MRPVTALWPRVASPKAEQVARAAPWQAAQATRSVGPRSPTAGELSQHALLAPGWDHGEPGVVRRGAGLDKPLLGVPRALTFVHLRQALLNARVNAGTDDALDLHALAREGVSTPQEFTQGFIERGKRVLRDHRVEPRRGTASSVRVLFQARSVGSARGGLPPGVTRQVTYRDVLTEAGSCPPEEPGRS